MVKLDNKVEKKRAKILIPSIILFVLICITASYINDKNSANVYNIATVTDDNALVFKDLKLIEMGNKLYIEKGCTINIKEGANCEEVSDINVEWYIDNKEVFKNSIEKIEGGTTEFITIPTIIGKVRVNSESILTMKMKYNVSGEEKEFDKDVKLKDWVSECAVYN